MTASDAPAKINQSGTASVLSRLDALEALSKQLPSGPWEVTRMKDWKGMYEDTVKSPPPEGKEIQLRILFCSQFPTSWALWLEEMQPDKVLPLIADVRKALTEGEGRAAMTRATYDEVARHG